MGAGSASLSVLLEQLIENVARHFDFEEDLTK